MLVAARTFCFVLLATGVVISAGCSSDRRDPVVEEISGTDFYSKEPESEVKFVLAPGGSMAEQLGIPTRKHYVELTVTNKRAGRLNLELIEAYVFSNSGSILRIIDKCKAAPISSGESLLFHLDTDGYMDHMLIEDSVREPLRMLIWFGDSGSFVTDLPAFQQLSVAGQVRLRWSAIIGTPVRADAAVKKATEWVPNNPLGSPILTRTQLPETAYYLYYPFPADKPVELSSERPKMY